MNDGIVSRDSYMHSFIHLSQRDYQNNEFGVIASVRYDFWDRRCEERSDEAIQWPEFVEVAD
ncbi:TPA: hypothetical protein ACT9K3_001594 [Legionella pneumophila]